MNHPFLTIIIPTYIGEKFYRDMISDHTQNVQQVFLHNEDSKKGRNRLANQSITFARIDRWRSILSPDQIAKVNVLQKIICCNVTIRGNYQL